jgi:predicted porin
MKWKLFCASVLLVLTSSAHGQSSVTLYGVLDSGFLYQNANARNFRSPVNLGHVYELKDGGVYSSSWGMTGVEDLGGGYKVHFKLQGAFNSATGGLRVGDTPTATAVFGQQTSVGVSGPFGRVDIGRQIVPTIYAMADTDARNAQYFGSILTAYLAMNQAAGWTALSSNIPLGALYEDNAIVYHSPEFYGASFALEYSPGGVPGQFQGGTRESIALKYSNYGLNLAAVYYTGHDTSPFATTSTGAIVTTPATGQLNNRFLYLGAMYTVNGVSVSTSYSIGRNPANIGRVNIEMISAALRYRVNPFLGISSGFYYLKDRNVSANQSTEFAIGADYSLSKSTLAYANVGYVNNKGEMSQTIEYGAPVPQGRTAVAAMIGIRHSF